MNAAHSARRAAIGFSLIEIVLALGIISFALVGIMGLFPVAMKSAQESQRETRATLLARQIFSDLASMNPTNTFIATNSDILTGRKAVSLRATSSNVVMYDVAGLPTGNTNEAIFEATIMISTNGMTSGVSHVQASIRPINSPSSPYAPYVFATLMNN